MLFHKIRLEAFSYDTEDLEKVKGALALLIPFRLEDKNFEITNTTGSFGNKITIVALEFQNSGKIRNICAHVRDSMGEKELLGLDIGTCLYPNCAFRLRISKQDACLGKIKIGDADSILLWGKVAVYPAKEEIARKILEDFWKRGQ